MYVLERNTTNVDLQKPYINIFSIHFVVIIIFIVILIYSWIAYLIIYINTSHMYLIILCSFIMDLFEI